MSRIHLVHTNQVCCVRGCVLAHNDGVHFLNPCKTGKKKILCMVWIFPRSTALMSGRGDAAAREGDGYGKST